MYVKYLINRIKSTPSKAWNDWKTFRNFPGMEYRDVHGVIPKSFMWKFPARGSVKYEPIHNSDNFKDDYKTPYRDSVYFVRRFHPEIPVKSDHYYNKGVATQDLINELDASHLNWKEDYLSQTRLNVLPNPDTLEEKHDLYAEQVENFFQGSHLANEFTNRPFIKDSVYEQYFRTIESFGTDKNVDPSDMDSKWLYMYFDNLQILHDRDSYLKEENDYKLDVYVGRPKTWQVLPDHFGKEQVDKIQAAIGAPLQDQLDEWESENLNRKIPMPITNDNIHKFRDQPDYFESLDHDYERIVYERQKNQKFEQMRNTQYDELMQIYNKKYILNH